jgi:ketosteroid isomerase-like protein
MKHVPLVLVLVIAATSLAYAQTPDKKPAPPAASKPADAGVEQTLMKLEQDALTALLKKDVTAFGKVFADDAVLTTPDGSLQTKAQLLADVKSGELVLESSTISDMKVRVHGDAAVVTYITTDKGKYKAQDISGRFRWTDTFVRRGGGWQLVAGHGTAIQPPPK